MYEDGIYHILLMSSPGHIYTELLNEDTSTKFGSFYVTNTLEVNREIMKYLTFLILFSNQL